MGVGNGGVQGGTGVELQLIFGHWVWAGFAGSSS